MGEAAMSSARDEEMPMTVTTILLLAAAGFLSGAVNAIARRAWPQLGKEIPEQLFAAYTAALPR